MPSSGTKSDRKDSLRADLIGFLLLWIPAGILFLLFALFMAWLANHPALFSGFVSSVRVLGGIGTLALVAILGGIIYEVFFGSRSRSGEPDTGIAEAIVSLMESGPESKPEPSELHESSDEPKDTSMSDFPQDEDASEEGEITEANCLGYDGTRKPQKDEVLQYLMEQAIQGRVPIYLAAVPFDLVVPFDPEYHPELTRDGRASIESIYKQWSEGKARGMFLYQSIDKFIVSDDYLVYFSCVKGQPHHVPAWILGKPDHPRVKELYGPFDMRDAEKLDLDEILRRASDS